MIAEITPQERLGLMLNCLEADGFNLWFDEKTKEWSLIYSEDNGDYNPLLKEEYYSVSGLDKEQVILMGYGDLCH